MDTATREVAGPGEINEVETLEFVINSKGGAKAYESAITLDTAAISFNAALLLIGLDPSRSVPSKRQFDPDPPQGDPVEIFFSWAKRRNVRVEELLFDKRTKKPLTVGRWVYTGSYFQDTGEGRPSFMAEVDGVLVGFMHGPSALIDNPRGEALGGFGHIVLNPHLGLEPGTPVTVTVKAVKRLGPNPK